MTKFGVFTVWTFFYFQKKKKNCLRGEKKHCEVLWLTAQQRRRCRMTQTAVATGLRAGRTVQGARLSSPSQCFTTVLGNRQQELPHLNVQWQHVSTKALSGSSKYTMTPSGLTARWEWKRSSAHSYRTDCWDDEAASPLLHACSQQPSEVDWLNSHASTDFRWSQSTAHLGTSPW